MTRAEREYQQWFESADIGNPTPLHAEELAYLAGYKKALALALVAFCDAHDAYLANHSDEDDTMQLMHAGDAGLEAIRKLDE